MPIFTVILARDAVERVKVTIMAKDVAEAGTLALAEVGRYGERVEGWNTDNSNQNNSEVYLDSEAPVEVPAPAPATWPPMFGREGTGTWTGTGQ